MGSDPVSKAMYTQFKTVSLRTSLGELSRILDHHHFALVVSEQKCYGSGGEFTSNTVITSIVTRYYF